MSHPGPHAVRTGVALTHGKQYDRAYARSSPLVSMTFLYQ